MEMAVQTFLTKALRALPVVHKGCTLRLSSFSNHEEARWERTRGRGLGKVFPSRLLPFRALVFKLLT